MQSKKQVDTPAYTSPGWFARACQVMQRTPSRRLDKDLAGKVGASGRNGPQLIRVFRALGLINEDGELTDRGRLVALGGDSYRRGIAEAVEDAYGGLVKQLVSERVSDASEIARRLGESTRASLGEGTRLQAARFLRFLVAESGVQEWTDAILSPGRDRPLAAASPKGRGATRRHAGRAGKQGALRRVGTHGALIPEEHPSEQIVSLRLTFGTARLHIPWQLAKEDVERLKRQIDVFPVGSAAPAGADDR